MTFEDGRINTCLFPRFSALEIDFKQSASTDMRTILQMNDLLLGALAAGGSHTLIGDSHKQRLALFSVGEREKRRDRQFRAYRFFLRQTEAKMSLACSSRKVHSLTDISLSLVLLHLPETTHGWGIIKAQLSLLSLLACQGTSYDIL